MGNPTKYKPEYVELCYKLCLLGHTDRELGSFFGVDEKSIRNWAKAHPEFGKARKEGKDIADAEVAQALLKRAKGMTVIKQKYDKDGGIVDLKEELPPDTKAAETWLSSRRGRDRVNWNPKQEIEHSGNVKTDFSFIIDDIREENEESSPIPSAASSDD